MLFVYSRGLSEEKSSGRRVIEIRAAGEQDLEVKGGEEVGEEAVLTLYFFFSLVCDYVFDVVSFSSFSTPPFSPPLLHPSHLHLYQFSLFIFLV